MGGTEMQIVTFYIDEDHEGELSGHNFVIDDGLDLDRVASASGYYSYQVVKSELEFVTLPNSIVSLDRVLIAQEFEQQELIEPVVEIPAQLIDVRAYR
jgi:hypothetical protein